MKCPKCGFWNKAGFPKCFRCGTPLGEALSSAAPPSANAETDDARGTASVTAAPIPRISFAHAPDEVTVAEAIGTPSYAQRIDVPASLPRRETNKPTKPVTASGAEPDTSTSAHADEALPPAGIDEEVTRRPTPVVSAGNDKLTAASETSPARTTASAQTTEPVADASMAADADPRTELQRTVQRMLGKYHGTPVQSGEPIVTTARKPGLIETAMPKPMPYVEPMASDTLITTARKLDSNGIAPHATIPQAEAADEASISKEQEPITAPRPRTAADASVTEAVIDIPQREKASRTAASQTESAIADDSATKREYQPVMERTDDADMKIAPPIRRRSALSYIPPDEAEGLPPPMPFGKRYNVTGITQPHITESESASIDDGLTEQDNASRIEENPAPTPFTPEVDDTASLIHTHEGNDTRTTPPLAGEHRDDITPAHGGGERADRSPAALPDDEGIKPSATAQDALPFPDETVYERRNGDETAPRIPLSTMEAPRAYDSEGTSYGAVDAPRARDFGDTSYEAPEVIDIPQTRGGISHAPQGAIDMPAPRSYARGVRPTPPSEPVTVSRPPAEPMEDDTDIRRYTPIRRSISFSSEPQTAAPIDAPDPRSTAGRERTSDKTPRRTAHTAYTQSELPHDERDGIAASTYKPSRRREAESPDSPLPRVPRAAFNNPYPSTPEPVTESIPSGQRAYHPSADDDAQDLSPRQASAYSEPRESVTRYTPVREKAAPQQSPYLPEAMRNLRNLSADERERYIASNRRDESSYTPRTSRTPAVTKQTVAAPRTASAAPRTRRSEPNMYLDDRGVGVKTMLTIVLWVLVLAALAFGVYQGIRWVSGQSGDLLFGNKEEEVSNALIEIGLVDGKPGRIITFTGNDDEQIFIPQLKKNWPFTNGVAKVPIADEYWIDADVEVERISVELTPHLYTAEGKRVDLAPITYDIEVLLSPLTVISPIEDRVEINKSNFTLKMEVEPGSRVTIQDKDVTDLIDKDNVITNNLKIDPIGDTQIQITVKTPGHRINRKVITVHRPKMDVRVELDDTTPDSSPTRTLVVKGVADPSATITVESSKNGDVEMLGAGKFQFTAKFSRYGANEIIVKASIQGKQDSVITHTVNYTPNIDEYSVSAYAMDYKTLSVNADIQDGYIYKCVGTVMEMLNADPCIFTMDVGDGNLVVIEMVPGKATVTGKKYSVFADVVGFSDEEGAEGLPKLIGRYIFDAK